MLNIMDIAHDAHRASDAFYDSSSPAWWLDAEPAALIEEVAEMWRGRDDLTPAQWVRHAEIEKYLEGYRDDYVSDWCPKNTDGDQDDYWLHDCRTVEDVLIDAAERYAGEVA